MHVYVLYYIVFNSTQAWSTTFVSWTYPILRGGGGVVEESPEADVPCLLCGMPLQGMLLEILFVDGLGALVLTWFPLVQRILVHLLQAIKTIVYNELK